MGSDQTILLVEEDATCRAFLADNLAEDGYQVASAETREQALALLASRRAHLVLADLNGQTLGLLDAVRGAGGLRDGIDPHVPLVVLSSRTDELARVRALERGADDVLAKPFSYPELRARLGAVLRRCYGRPRQVLRVGSLTLDRGTRRVWVGERRGGAVGQGVRAPRRAGSGARARSHQGGAPARRVGAGKLGANAHA